MKPACSFHVSIKEPDPPEIKPFSSPSALLDYVTDHWEDNFVTVDLETKELVELFVKRPFFLLVSVDAPLSERYRRSFR
jgi:dCMP deaminase